ncbi:serine-rich adhesin for platelets isoform X5 [Drosophila virilis]|uniref:serine-rich adhesin for platelets isoform X5 n=1 Tax=Drosophila virilis TaxID=7244 RepID=UPI0013960F05|nr:putative uncharacterized protein DDB_G0277255 isoform X5 [Drosophila virilis]
MDTTNSNQTGTPVLKSLAASSVLQESRALLTQLDSVEAANAVLPVNAAIVSTNKNQQDEPNTHDTIAVVSDQPVTSTLTSITMPNTTAVGLNLPPPTPNLSVAGSATDVDLLSCLLPAPSSFVTSGLIPTSTPPPHTSLDQTAPAALTPAPCASDFDSDTELSIVAATAATEVASTVDNSTTSPISTLSCAPVQTALLATTNGHINRNNTSSSCPQLSLNTKQQRQQKRRRERAQRLQAERDSRCNLSALSGTLIAGSVGVGVSLGIGTVTGGSSGGIIGSVTAPNIIMGNSSAVAPGNSLLYNLNSAGSMGEDSNNSNGNFTSSSNGSNNLLPPTDSIASLLLNPPHSPECNSGLMATPSDSEGESLDEDLLSTSSSSTLLLPRDKPPPRPPPPVRRKLPRSPVLEEEIIDGFAILEFKTYEDLEFAIKLGQKRKEKRLSALEELTCTYSIEEMKMPKIIDTGQPHTLRTSNLSSLSIVSNNNLKEVNHHQHRGVGAGMGGTIVATSNSISTNINNNTANHNNSNTVYTVPLASMCNAPDTEADNWVEDPYRQQQDQLSGSASTISIDINSNANQNQISNNQHLNHLTQSKQTASSVININNTTIPGAVNTVTDSCLLDNGNAKLSIGSVVPHINLSDNGNESSGSESKSQNTKNANQPNNVAAEYISIKSTKSNDATTLNSRLKVISSSCPKIKKLNGLECSKDDVITTEAIAAGLTLEIQDFTNSSAKVVGASLLLKKDNDLNESFTDNSNHCTSNFNETNICDKTNGGNKNPENLVAFVFPSTPNHVSNDALQQSSPHNSTEYPQPHTTRTECVAANVCGNDVPELAQDTSTLSNTLPGVGANGSLIVAGESISESAGLEQIVSVVPPTLLTTKSATGHGNNQKLSAGTDNLPHTTHHPAATSAQVTSLSNSSGCESYLTSEAGRCGLELTSSVNAQGITLSNKIVTPLGMETPVQKPTIPLGTPFTSVTIAPLHGSFGERTSNLLLAANIKSKDNSMLSMDGLATAASLDSQKSTNSSIPTSTSSIANGFLSGHTSVSCVTSNVGSVLSHIAPHSGNKVLSVPMTLPPITAVSSGAAAASGISKTTVSTGSSPVGAAGSSLVFHGAPPLMPHSGAGLPMLIQATPYRTSFPHYSALYTPYNNIAHGQYLSQVIPIGSSNTSSSPQRSDARNSRESATTSSLKAPVTSASTHHQYSVSGIGGMRSITPLGYVISNNNTTQVLGTMATTTVRLGLLPPDQLLQHHNCLHPPEFQLRLLHNYNHLHQCKCYHKLGIQLTFLKY